MVTLDQALDGGDWGRGMRVPNGLNRETAIEQGAYPPSRLFHLPRHDIIPPSTAAICANAAVVHARLLTLHLPAALPLVSSHLVNQNDVY
jgi:hypothetical protein